MGKNAEPTYVVGFDLGGTKMLAAVMDHQDTILGRAKRKTKAQEDPEVIYGRIAGTIDDALQEAEITKSQLLGIGIGSPGPLDSKKGVILETPNLNMHHFPLADRLKKDFGCPVVLENDVSTGTYGEFMFGAGKGYKHVLGVFPGTGIGGGLVLDGKLYTGATGAAGEVGHMILVPHGPMCGCGQQGCLEAVASRTAIAKDMIHLAALPALLLVLRR